MAEILGLGCTHRPLMLRRDEDWTSMMRTALADPDMPAAAKNPAGWPVPLREELGNDWGAAAAGRAREVYRRHFAEARRALDEFHPDVIVMFGDDQYENFKEDIVPPFAGSPTRTATSSPGRTAAPRTIRGARRPTRLSGCAATGRPGNI